MSFLKNTNRTASGKKKHNKKGNTTDEQNDFLKSTNRDHTGRKKRRGN